MDKLEWLQEDAVMTRTQSILARFDAAELTLSGGSIPRRPAPRYAMFSV